MSFTSKLVTTAAIVGAATGIYAYKQINKSTTQNNLSNTSDQKTQTNSTSTTGDTSFNTVATKTVTGYTTTPINTTEGNQPITEFNFDSLTYPITDTNIKIDTK
jgi:hypothetical protein